MESIFFYHKAHRNCLVKKVYFQQKSSDCSVMLVLEILSFDFMTFVVKMAKIVSVLCSYI